MVIEDGARDKSVQSVDRAISILQVLARRGVAGVTEIAREMILHKSTVSRLLGTLQARGLVEPASSRGRYRLAYGVVQLAEGVSKKHDQVIISRTVCDALAEAVGETVNVAVREGHAVVTIDQVIGSAQVTSVNWVGQHNSLHATSAGKVFLANMSQAELREFLSEPMETFTEFTIAEPERMLAELETVREQGYGFTLDEQELGLAAIAAPVRALDGRVIAALVVSGPTFRINADAVPGIAVHVCAAAAEISQRNGYPKAG